MWRPPHKPSRRRLPPSEGLFSDSIFRRRFLDRSGDMMLRFSSLEEIMRRVDETIAPVNMSPREAVRFLEKFSFEVEMRIDVLKQAIEEPENECERNPG
jgi:hypothetical protein